MAACRISSNRSMVPRYNRGTGGTVTREQNMELHSLAYIILLTLILEVLVFHWFGGF